MVPPRERVDKDGQKPAYPTLDEVAAQRREFLKTLGRGALVASTAFAGVSCMGISTEHASEPDVPPTPGVAPADVVEPVDVLDRPDLSGVVPDVQEPDYWTTGGVAPPPDVQEPTPDATTLPGTIDVPALPGEAPSPVDVVGGDSGDVEEDAFPPLAGDMPAPEE